MSPALAGFGLEGRRALVTGASRGIGRAIALGLARAGAEILLHYHRGQDAAETALGEIRAAGGQGLLLQADLTEAKGGADLAKAALGSGPLDILVLNAAIQELRPLQEIDHDSFLRQAHANFWSAIQLVQAVLSGMIERRWGRILAIGSVQQIRPNPNLAVYAGLKSALSNMMIGLSKAHAGAGITANVLAPGLINTDRTEYLKADPALHRSVLERIPAGAAGRAEDCVGAAQLLCSDAGRYITGIDLLVDGGMHIP